MSRRRRKIASQPPAPPALVARRRAVSVSDAMQAQINYGQDEGKIKSAVPDLMQHLSDDRLVALSMSGFGHRLTHGIAGDILARGWSSEGQTDEFDDTLNVRAKFEEALAAERLFGGAHLLMVCDDTDDLSQPLPPEPVDVLALHLLIPRDARPRSREQDLRSPRWSLPDVWDVQPQRQGMHTRSTPVHASRLLTFPGLRIPPGIVAPRDGYGLSVLDVYWPAIRAIELVLEGMVYAGIEYSTAWVRLKQSLAAASASDNDQPTLEDRMRLYRDSASMARVRLLLGDDETGRDSVNLTGLRTEVLMAQYERVPTVEGLPLTAAIGMSPSGMSTDDASGARTYHRFIRSQRDNRLSPLLRQLHRAQFGETIPHEWEPIEESDPLASAALVQAGIADPDELRERHGLPQRAVEMEPTAAEEDAALAALAALVAPSGDAPAAPVAGGLPDDEAAPPTPDEPAAVAFTGIQISSTTELLRAVQDGTFTRETVELLLVETLGFVPEKARALVNSIVVNPPQEPAPPAVP